MMNQEQADELQAAAIALTESKKDPRNNEKQHFQAHLRLVKAKLAAKLTRDCYSKEDLEIAKSLPEYVEPVGKYGLAPKKKKIKA